MFSVTAKHQLLSGYQLSKQLGVTGFTIRILAKLIDYAMSMLIFGAAVYAMKWCCMHAGLDWPATLPARSKGLALIWIFISPVTFFTPSEAIAGCTLGKVICRLRVIKDNGQPCSFVAAFLRNLLLPIDGGLILLICLMESPLNQRVGDMTADTVVVSRAKSQHMPKLSGLRPWLGISASCLLFAFLAMGDIWLRL